MGKIVRDLFRQGHLNEIIISQRLQWLQDPSKINGDNLINIKRETSRQFRNKKREYLKDNIDEPATNSKNKNVRDVYR
jgi:hypothetical protein